MSDSQIQFELEPARQRQPNKRGMCVLVVEDDDADAYLIERALLGNPDVDGVVRATDGVEALRLVETGAIEPDIAFIDLSMPRKDGFHLLAELAVSGQPRFPMVVLTSSAVPRDAVRSRFRGATRVLSKPDTLEDLERVLSATITAAYSGVTLPRRHRAAPKQPAGA